MTPWTFRATASNGTLSSPYIEVAFPEFAHVNGTKAARYQPSSWLGSFDDLYLGGAYGKVSAAVDLGGTEYDVVIESATTPQGPAANTYMANHRYDANFPSSVAFPRAPFPSSPSLNLGCCYAGPPVVTYGSDDYPEVMGVGTDGCLYETWIDWWSGAPVANGPFFTGACGLL
jgi:hypothetical protein